jgi:membrane protein
MPLPTLRRLHDLLLHDLWREAPAPSRGRSVLLQTVRVVVLAARNFWRDHCLLHATSLAFVTLLSFVPLLAFAFSILKGFKVEEHIKPWLIRQVTGSEEPLEGGAPAPQAPSDSAEAQAAQGQKQLIEAILSAIERTDVRALGTIGLLFLLWTTIKLLSTIEDTFNHIWDVQRSRTFSRKIADYVSVVVIAPILLLAAMSVTTAFQSTALVTALRETAIFGPVATLLLGWLPYVGTWIAFTAVYLFMPNTRVRLRAGLIGGIVAGTAWQIAFWFYTHSQILVARYGAIYATFAAIPVFMVWLYVSWTIVLFGAEMACAVQNVGRYWEEERAAGASFAVLEAIALRAMLALSTAFRRDGRALAAEEIAERCKAPARLVADVLRMLAQAGLCTEVAGEPNVTAYHPGRALEKMTPADVLAALRYHGRAVALSTGEPEAALAAELLAAHERTCAADLARTTFQDLARRLEERPQA